MVVLDYPFRQWSFPLFGYTFFSDPVIFVTDNNRSIILILVLIQLAIYLVTAIGIWQLREWSRLLAIFNSIFSLISIVLRFFTRSITGVTLLTIIVLISIVVYLSLPNVSQEFS